MSNKMKLSIILPSYKEAENLKIILPLIVQVIQERVEFEICVIDSQLPMDNTKEICEGFERVRYINREGGNRYGDAIRTGISEAKGEYIVVMDADGSHHPKYILEMLPLLNEGVDVVIGSRYCGGGKTENKFLLRFLSKIVNTLYSILFGLNIKDVSNSFRGYKSTIIKSLKLACNNFDIVEEILIKIIASEKGVVLREIPILFEKRKTGKSKRVFIVFAISYFKSIIKIKRMKP
jgi:dolichol-phosphate mannosyltransferase